MIVARRRKDVCAPAHCRAASGPSPTSLHAKGAHTKTNCTIALYNLMKTMLGVWDCAFAPVPTPYRTTTRCADLGGSRWRFASSPSRTLHYGLDPIAPTALVWPCLLSRPRRPCLLASYCAPCRPLFRGWLANPRPCSKVKERYCDRQAPPPASSAHRDEQLA